MLIVNNPTDVDVTAWLEYEGLQGKARRIKTKTSGEVPAIKKGKNDQDIYLTRCGTLTCLEQPRNAQANAFEGNICLTKIRVTERTCIAEITERLHLVIRYEDGEDARAQGET